MLVGLLHSGSGLGDQLFRLITVRTLAQDKGFDYGMVGQFKGDFFINQPNIIGEFTAPYTYNEKDLRDTQGNDVRSFDPESQFVNDNTIIDGSFEDSKYWEHNLDNISKWLAVEPLEMSDDICVVGFRGGEYAASPELFLPTSYFKAAGEMMLNINPNMKFQIHTDDPYLAKNFFSEIWSWPDFEVIENTSISHSKHTNMGFNWRSARYAKYAIIANSSFYILPRLLRHEVGGALTIAPRYWARRNVGVWARPSCYYSAFRYI